MSLPEIVSEGRTSPRPEGALLVRTVPSPVGPLALAVSAVGLMQLHFGTFEASAAGLVTSEASRSRNASIRLAAGFMESAVRQVDAYFAGTLHAFDIALDLRGTPFQLRVWQALKAIPYGEKSTYGEVARALGDIHLARAVGAATGANPVAIVVPCHRLVGSDGDLTGFAGGIRVKQALLRHESQATVPDLFGGF